LFFLLTPSIKYAKCKARIRLEIGIEIGLEFNQSKEKNQS